MIQRVKKLGLFMVMLMLVFTMCQPVYAAKKVKLNAKKKTLYVGKTYTLKLKNAKKSKVKWKSSKKSVATVNKKGKVTAKKAGKTVITAKYKNKKYKCKITVKKKKATTTVTYGSASGTVTLKSSGKPDVGARVYLLPNTKSNKNGKYESVNLPVFESSKVWENVDYINSFNSKRVYATKVGEDGKYKFGKVVSGVYWMVIVSKNKPSKPVSNPDPLYEANYGEFSEELEHVIGFKNCKLLYDSLVPTDYQVYADYIIKENTNVVCNEEF